MHKFVECPYLFTEVRKSGWNPKPDIEKKVKEALANAHDGIKKALERAKTKLEKKVLTLTPTLGPTPTTSTKPGNFVAQQSSRPGNFMLALGKRIAYTPKFQLPTTYANSSDLPMVSDSPATDLISTQSPYSPKSSAFRVTAASSNKQYILQKSFILDSGATCHVCNNKSRFIDFRLPSNDDVLYAGEGIIPIEGFGTVSVTVTTTEEPSQYTFYLYDVVFISLFHTSVASL